MAKSDDVFAGVGKALGSNSGTPTAAGRPKPMGEWVADVPADAPPRLELFKKRKPSAWWTYRNAGGRIVLYVARFDGEAGEKEIVPQTLWKEPDGLKWHWRGAPAPRPLYNLQALTDRPDYPVLIVEGEKTADAAAGLFPAFVAMTWPGGSAGVNSSDWRPLAGREIIVIPDNDDPGRKAADHVRKRALEAGAASVAVIALPSGLPDKWDVADAWPHDFSLADLTALIGSARRGVPADTTWPRGIEADATGLWSVSSGRGDGEEPPARQWLCGPLNVIGKVRDQENGNWGKVLEFADYDGLVKRIVIQDAEFAGEALDVRRRLLSAGLPMRADKFGRDTLAKALLAVRTSRRARLAFTSGWVGDSSYMLPGGPIGTSAEAMIYAGPNKASYHGQAGELEVWREKIAAAASGNHVLLFALSCAFAAPLLRPLGGEGGGFHFRGSSACGKTTALIAAGSVWGGGGNHGFVQTWRNTANAIESIAHAHNDGPLCFDEIKTLGADSAGDAAYALATGQMKGRQNSNSDLRARVSWIVQLLSTGEMSLADLVRSGKNRERVYAGQELRLIDLGVEIQRVDDLMSAWQNIHGAQSHADFSDGLKAVAKGHYGWAGPLFLERLIARREGLLEAADQLRHAFVADVMQAGDTGQIRRGAERFALVAAGGELATLLDVVPWRAGEASAAAAFLFKRWAQSFGRKRSREDLEAIREVREFLERYEHSRFRWLKPGMTEEEALVDDEQEAGKPRQGEARSLDLAGWKSIIPGKGLVFHFNPEFWKRQMFLGIGTAAATKAIKSAGFLVHDKEPGRLTHKVRVPGGPTRPFYTVTGAILEGAVDGDD